MQISHLCDLHSQQGLAYIKDLMSSLFHKATLAAIASILLACTPASSSDTSLKTSAKTAASPSAIPTKATLPQESFSTEWDMVAAESHIKFTASQTGNIFTGEFTDFTAAIVFDPDNLSTARVRVEIDLTQFDAGDRDRNGALPGKDWFYTKKFPEAVFISDVIIQDGEDYIAKGQLSLRGVDKPLNLPFTLTIDSNRADMAGMITINRGDWGVGQGAWSTDEWVSTQVTIDVKITATKSIEQP